MNEKIIVFTSEHDDAELFCSAAGEIWKRFGTEYKRLVVGLNKEKNADIYCWSGLPVSWDVLVIWEPPVGAQSLGVEYYAEHLDTLKAECNQCVNECGIVRVLYHNSTKEKYKLKQSMFIKELISEGVTVLEYTYSHMAEDSLYQKAALLLAAGWNMESKEKYQKKIDDFSSAWPERKLPYCNMLILLVGAALQALENGLSGKDLQESWKKVFVGSTVKEIREGIMKETIADSQKQLIAPIQLLDSIESGDQPTPIMLEKVKQALLQIMVPLRRQS